MRTHTLFALAGLLAALPFTAHAKIERVIEKTFTVSLGGHLNVETQGGNIEVVTAQGGEVRVIARQVFKADSESEADEIAKDLLLRIDQSGDDVSAVAKYEGKRRGGFFGGSTPVSVNFQVAVPSRFNVEVRTSGGNLQVGDLEGQVDGRTSGGNIQVGNITGKVNVHTSGGNIRVGQTSDALVAHTSGGDVRVDSVVGDAQLKTSGGNISIDSASGAVDAQTSGGNVSAHFANTALAASTLRTSGGNVSVTVSPAAKFRLDASTSGGNVRVSGVEIQVESGQNGKSKLVGTVNGGGPALKLRTSGGDVRVAAND